MAALPGRSPGPAAPLDPRAPTAVMLVGSYAGLGVHALLTVQRLFPNHFKNVIFLSVGVIDAATMKGVEEVDRVRERTEAVAAAVRRPGPPARARRRLPARRSPPRRCRRRSGWRSRSSREFPRVGLLRGQAHLQGGALLPAAPPQRDRLLAAAPAAVRRDERHGASRCG